MCKERAWYIILNMRVRFAYSTIMSKRCVITAIKQSMSRVKKCLQILHF